MRAAGLWLDLARLFIELGERDAAEACNVQCARWWNIGIRL